MKRVSRRAWNLDIGFSMCGMRLGWSSIIGILPVVGDLINLYLSLQVIRLSNTVDDALPPAILAQMILNIVIDFVLGILPILGTIAGALYKANSRNSLILEHFLKKRAAENIAKGLYVDSSKEGSSKGTSSGAFSSAPDSSLELNVPVPGKIRDENLAHKVGPEGTRVPGAPHPPSATTTATAPAEKKPVKQRKNTTPKSSDGSSPPSSTEAPSRRNISPTAARRSTGNPSDPSTRSPPSSTSSSSDSSLDTAGSSTLPATTIPATHLVNSSPKRTMMKTLRS